MSQRHKEVTTSALIHSSFFSPFLHHQWHQGYKDGIQKEQKSYKGGANEEQRRNEGGTKEEQRRYEDRIKEYRRNQEVI